ncbi:MAG: MBL fold metallo-hydrolase [Anderseniella sp.]|jgi:flavorubredoxin|nr:MBL fold metallo-hydrolase [Anderseniella sp.]
MTTPDAPMLLDAQKITDEWSVLPAFFPIPGMGGLAVNSFLLKGPEPVLVDTGLACLGGQFMDALEAEIDLDDLRWIWLSHTDADHIGNLAGILARAPNARVVTSFLGMGKMGMLGHDVSRVHLLQPGDHLEIAGRRLVPLRPPYYDAPETIGFVDTGSKAFFAADSFGALLPGPADDVSAVEPDVLRDGLVTWASIDAPWLASADRHALGRTLGALDAIDPSIVMSGHLPVMHGDIRSLTRIVHDSWGNGPADGIDPLAAETVAATFG